MSTVKRLGAIAAAAAAVTTGALVFAPPAMAAADPTYTCDAWTGAVYTEFSRAGGNLVIDMAIPGGINTLVPLTITTRLGTSAAAGPSANLPIGNHADITLVGTYATLAAAPAIHMTVKPAGGVGVPVECWVATNGTGWPV